MFDSKAKTYTLKIRGGRKRDEIMKNKGGRGALIQEDMSATLATFQDQTLFVQKKQIICVATQQGGGRDNV